MAFENGLNPEVVLQGTATTHPTLAQPLTTQLESSVTQGLGTAQTGQAKAATALLGEQATAANIQNQISQFGLQNAKLMGEWYSNAAKGNPSAQPSAGVAPGGGSPSAPMGGGGAPAPGAVPVLPEGVHPGWSVDKNADWYVDSDGKPVSFLTGPKYTPNGLPNMNNEDMIRNRAQFVASHSPYPAGVFDQMNKDLQTAQGFDEKYADIYSKNATAQKAMQDVKGLALTHAGNVANEVINDPDPAGAFTRALQANPKLMAQTGIDPSQVVDPNTNQLTEYGKNTLGALSAQSEAKKTAAEINVKTGELAVQAADITKKQAETGEITFKNINEASQKVQETAQDINARQKSLGKTSRANDLVGTNPLGIIGGTLAQAQKIVGGNPQYSELQTILNTDALMDMRSALQTRMAASEFNKLFPNQVSADMPMAAVRNLLKYSSDWQKADLTSVQSRAKDLIKAAAPFGVQTDNLTTLANAPPAVASPVTSVPALRDNNGVPMKAGATPTATPKSNLPMRSPEAAMKLTPGTHYLTLEGREFIR